MSRRVLVATLALVGLLAPAAPCLAQFDGYCFRDFLGLYTEEDAVLCQTEANVPGQTVRLWLIVTFGLHNDNPVAELHADFSGFPSEGVVTAIDWLVPPTAGGSDLDGLLTWQFDPPWLHHGPIVVLATIDVQVIEPLASDIVVAIQDGSTVDVLGQAYRMLPRFFTFNCTGAESPSCMCEPLDDCPAFPWLAVETPQPPSGSVVLGDFTLTFSLSSYFCTFSEHCYPGYAARSYAGEVLVGDVQAATFAGSGGQLHTVQLSTAGWPPGSELPITLHATNAHGEQIVHLAYVVDVNVPALPASWSRVKSRY